MSTKEEIITMNAKIRQLFWIDDNYDFKCESEYCSMFYKIMEEKIFNGLKNYYINRNITNIICLYYIPKCTHYFSITNVFKI